MKFAFIDYAIFVVYGLCIVGIAFWVTRKRDKTSEDYFLAGKSLPWWAIGASLIAANISAEQFIGMSGSGFAIGLAIASYEWMAALTLLIVGKFFLPIFIEKKIYTIPEFVEKRYGENLKTILAVFWICLYIFVNPHPRFPLLPFSFFLPSFPLLYLLPSLLFIPPSLYFHLFFP